MAVMLMESFDHYDTLSQRGWFNWSAWGAPTSTSTSANRTGTRGLRMVDARYGLARSFGGTATTGVVGAAFRLSTLVHSVGVVGLFEAGANQHIYVFVDLSGAISVKRYTGSGTGTQIGSSTAPIIAVNTWYYIELAATIHDTTGSFTVYVNGVSVLTGSNLDTKATTNGYISGITLGAHSDQFGASSNIDFDDVYCITGTTTPLGDCKVECLFPSGNGNSSQLVGSDSNSTDNYLLVDEVPPSASDYVGSATAGEKDTYAFGNLATAAGTVHAVQPNITAFKSDAGPRTVASVARLSSTEVDSAARGLSTSSIMHSDIRETKPGGGAWTVSDVNAAEFGMKVAS